jgi:hypothetical protein
MKNNYRIQKNTDTVDIDAQCIGLSAWQIEDSTNQLNSKRGLNIQIRHNNQKDVFEAASELANIIATAPQMLDFLNNLYIEMSQQGEYKDEALYSELTTLILKAKGR